MPKTTPTKELVGERIADALRAADRKPVWLAVELDVHPDTVDRWLAGKTAPSFLQMQRIATRLDQPLEWFLGDEVAA